MEQKKGILIIALIFAGIVLLGTCAAAVAAMVHVKALEATLSNLSVSWPSQPVVYEDGEGEEPSILADSSLKLLGEDTISLKSKTIACRASITPAEFKQGTTAKIKVKNDGKVYTLKRKENSFEGTIRLPLAEFAHVEAILEDEDTVRSEYIDGKSPYIRTDIAWSAAGDQPRIRKDSALFEWSIEDALYAEDRQTDFPEIQIVGLTDGKQVYKKTVKGEYSAGRGNEEASWHYLWEGKVPLDGGKRVELYVVTEAKAGLTYRCQIGQVQRQMAEDFWADGEKTYLEILAPDGTVLSRVNPYDEEGEDEL